LRSCSCPRRSDRQLRRSPAPHHSCSTASEVVRPADPHGRQGAAKGLLRTYSAAAVHLPGFATRHAWELT
jgi:hypothetical protein